MTILWSTRGPTRRLTAACTVAVLALALPALAHAHSGSATVSCTGADFTFGGFQPGSNTVHYIVAVDNQPAAQGAFALNEAGGTAGSLHVGLSITGTHSVEANAWWAPEETAGGQSRASTSPPLASTVVTCAAPPPAAPPAPAAVSAPAPPASGVAGQRASSPASVARLSVASVCTSRRVRMSVSGRSMREVAFALNGRHVRTVAVRPGQRSVRVSLPMGKRAVSPLVTARVRFRNGARPRTLSHFARRCSPVAVQPQFTG